MRPTGGLVLVLIGTMAGEPAAAACLRALRPLAAGEVASVTAFAPAPCEAPQAALTYDRGLRVARARRDIAVGEVVRGAASLLAAAQAGDALILQARVGPVLVERTVKVARPARPGEPLIVDGGDGRVFAAPAPVRP